MIEYFSSVFHKKQHFGNWIVVNWYPNSIIFMKYIIALVLPLLIGSCSKPEENFIKIPSEFLINVQEEIISDGSRKIWLELSSIQAQYCQDDSLVYNQHQVLSEFNIEILDTYKANHCISRIFPLKSKILLPDFDSTLTLHIFLGSSSVITCAIQNNPDNYTFELVNGTGLILKHNKTFKIPLNLIWGYAYQKSFGPTSEILMSNFKKDIEYDCRTDRMPKGFYSYFSILDNNVLVLNENPGIAGNYLKFYYTHNKTNASLVEFFNGLAAKYVDLVGYKINSGAGHEFKSN